IVTALLILWRPQAFAPLPGWREMKGYIPPLYAALALAGVGTLSVLLYGRSLGVTTSYAKVAAHLEQLLIPGHLAATPFFQTQKPIVFPFIPDPLTAGPGPTFDGIMVMQYPLIIGIILGSALSAWQLGEWRWSAATNWRQTSSVLFGGLLMGLASRMAAGCNIQHLWGGLPIFSVQSLLFLAGILPGAWLGGRLLVRWVLPEKV
ncbi:MAG: YeeE/YedE family protein, partial [Desulfuromonadales bacterium]|nr:YeeE/YedE family protein [Desulfuromonadales bacterium]